MLSSSSYDRRLSELNFGKIRDAIKAALSSYGGGGNDDNYDAASNSTAAADEDTKAGLQSGLEIYTRAADEYWGGTR